MKKFNFMLSAIVLMAFGGAAPALAAEPSCGLNSDKAANEGEPIVIGAIVSQTGPDDFSASAKAAQAYFDCVNDKGGIHGRPIQYLIGDDQWTPEVASQLAAKFVNDEEAVVMAGNSSFVECAANAQLYKDEGLVAVAGVGVPRECFTASHYAPLNAGPRLSTTAAAEFASETLDAESFVCIGPNIPNVGAWSCEGVQSWAESKGLKSSTLLIDPGSLDAASVILQAVIKQPDAIILSLPKGLTLPLLTAAEEQGFHDSIHFLSAASGYDISVPDSLGAAWDGKFYANMEFNPLYSEAADNKNWRAVMDAYADADTPRDTFAQGGYLAARVVTEALLSLEPDAISRASVTQALGAVTKFESDILCANWYYGKEAARQNANHATRMAVTKGNGWETITECRDSGDPELADVLAYEEKMQIER